MTRLLISETFGPTIQGEGPSAGRPSLFVRLGMCNLDCSWCDTPFTWDWTGKNGVAYDKRHELSHATVDELLDWVDEHDTSTVVISGGEPLIQSARLAPFVEQLLDNGRNVEVETNGTLSPTKHLAEYLDRVRWNVSPKLSGSNVDVTRAENLPVLEQFANIPTAIFKFVITNIGDLLEADELVDTTGMPSDRVWLMPEGRTGDEITERLPWVIDKAITRNYNVSTRIHVHAYGDRRGV